MLKVESIGIQKVSEVAIIIAAAAAVECCPLLPFVLFGAFPPPTLIPGNKNEENATPGCFAQTSSVVLYAITHSFILSLFHPTLITY